MAGNRFAQPELRKPVGSPRSKGRDNSKDTLCRNVLIYGHCRYEDQGCSFNHDPNKTIPAQVDSKKSLNVDSPAFTPSIHSNNNTKAASLPSQAANAAPFTPRGLGSITPQPQPEPETMPTAFNPAAIKEFTPQTYDASHSHTPSGGTSESYDPFSMHALNQTMPSTQYNPYLEESTHNAASYFNAAPSFAAPAQPLQYHLYAPIGPHREDLLQYQRTVHDFFIPNELREELQKKIEATRQVMPNSQLPSVEHYHSLVPLDTNHHESATVFGYPSWVYKAMSSKNGRYYVLRRLKGYRLSNERAIRSVKEWKRVDSGSVVSVVDAFTTRAFGDSSLIFVYYYHPVSKTLIEHHLTTPNRGLYGSRAVTAAIPEQVIWNYIVQIASAIKCIHLANLAVRCIDPSKVILTEKGRIRLNACAVLDVVQFESNKPLIDLQQDDFALFGRLILCLVSNTPSMVTATKLSVENAARTYSVELRDTITWLLTPAPEGQKKDVDELIRGISPHVLSLYDSSIHLSDTLTATLSGELENGRLARLLMKLGTVNERPEYENDARWSEYGERFMLQLFRDYVFHQVDAEGKPVVDMGHIVEALNKLDAGSGQMIKLVSRDEANLFFVSYRELKKVVEQSFMELVRKEGRRL